ncbi:sel1 repeat family protein, partial [Burkholderia thailandensis]
MNPTKNLLSTRAATPPDHARRPSPPRRMLRATLSPFGMLAVAAALAAGVAATGSIGHPASGAPSAT